MTSRSGRENFRSSVDWPLVEGVATLLKETCEGLELDRDREWLGEIITEAAEGLPTSLQAGQQSEYVAEYILGVSAARNSLVIVSYCFNFLKSQGLVTEEKADHIEQALEELESSLDGLTQSLRRSLPDQWRFSNN
ncbi:MAG TPA: four helix bundle protein [Dehalococcoidia bacterium]|nr:four helix bundle protein [Dehalococcoidia bacterium]